MFAEFGGGAFAGSPPWIRPCSKWEHLLGFTHYHTLSVSPREHHLQAQINLGRVIMTYKSETREIRETKSLFSLSCTNKIICPATLSTSHTINICSRGSAVYAPEFHRANLASSLNENWSTCTRKVTPEFSPGKVADVDKRYISSRAIAVLHPVIIFSTFVLFECLLLCIFCSRMVIYYLH